MSTRARLLVSVAALAVLLAAPAMAQPYGLPSPQPVAPYLNGSLPSRTPGTSGSWSVENAFPGLTFRDPLQLIEIPGADRFLMIGKAGEVWVFEDDPATAQKTLVLDIVDQVMQQPDGGLLGAVLHPDFGQPGSTGERAIITPLAPRE